ncbi:MAG: fused MFS/spermidine synthase [Deltaproteobacteria bacterium]|nr:fused MFS/spermidine synthase [Deltaproteobacteria bacterium]
MRDRSFWPVALCFLLSGFAALIYQTAWTRAFAFVFGTSELAVATVLAAYMGGLAAGSWVAGRHAHRVRRPVLVYGALEGGIAAAALAVPLAVRAATALHGVLFGGQPEVPSSGGTGSALYFLGSSFLILLVPTALMGATLPLLARSGVHTQSQIGSRIGALYALNTAGAVAGTGMAAFWLLPALGLSRTVLVAVAANVVVFAIAAALARTAPPLAPATASTATPRRGFHWILPAVLVSGAVSFGYEVFWFRLLSHLLGGSVHAFSTMLASFLIGIAAGSAIAARLASSPERGGRGFAIAQLGIAALSVVAYTLLDRTPALAGLLAGVPREGADALIAIAVLLPGTLCIGATFPFAVRVLARTPEEASAATARVYAWNTVGAIAGSIGAGFWLIPALGFPGALAAFVAASALLALLAATASVPRAPGLALGAAALALAAVLVPLEPPWTLLRTGPLVREPQPGKVAFDAVGRTATVLLLDEGSQWSLRTNGLPESTVMGRHGRPMKFGSGRWLGILPTLARPESRELLVVGLGGGVAIELVPPSIERIDVIELEPEVVEANRRLSPLRRFDPLADPRVRVHVNDARGALQLTSRRFDAIVSQPSHPWTAGASHLYTREFFQLARRHLRPGGVLVQWMGMHFVDTELLRVLLATLLDSFPHVRVYGPYLAGEFAFVASEQPLPIEETSARALAAAPGFFARLGLLAPEAIAADLLLDEQGVRAFAAGAPVGTDDRNLLQTRSPGVIARNAGLTPAAALAALAGQDPLPGLVRRMDPLLLADALQAHAATARALQVADGVEEDPGLRHTVLGWIAASSGQAQRAGQELDAALAKDPHQPFARAALLRVRRGAYLRSPETLAQLAPLAPEEQAVLDAWRALEAGDEAASAALEPRLAAIDPRHPLAREALRARADARVARGDPASAVEALALLDDAMQYGARPEDFVARARAALLAGDPDESIDTLAQLLPWVESNPNPGAIAQQALAFLDGIPADADAMGRRAGIRVRFERAAHGGRQAPRGAARARGGRTPSG